MGAQPQPKGSKPNESDFVLEEIDDDVPALIQQGNTFKP